MGLFKRSSGSATTTLHAAASADTDAGAPNLPAQGAIADAPMRVRVRVSGEIVLQRIVPRAGSTVLEIVLSDGTAEAVALFTGRQSLGGMHQGREVMIEGVAHIEDERRVFINPGYTLL